ncbi:MAG: hypothetical protein KDA21_00575, partial [Phycisphaerales bacterium]|nr:hypothetical protein [Phycisphaerales bacterium]
ALPNVVLVRIAPIGEGAWSTPTYDSMIGMVIPTRPRDALLQEMVRRARARELSPAGWSVMLRRFETHRPEVFDPLRGYVTRPVWARGHSLSVRYGSFESIMVPPTSLEAFVGLREDDIVIRHRIVESGPGFSPVSAQVDWMISDPLKNCLEIPAGLRRGRLELEIGLMRNGTLVPIWRGSAGSFTVADSISDIMTPAVSESLSAQIEDLKPTLFQATAGSFYLLTPSVPLYADLEIGVGIDVEVRRNGQPVAHGRYLARVIEGPQQDRDHMWISDEATRLHWTTHVTKYDPHDAQWTILFRGTPEAALHATWWGLPGQTHYPSRFWQGELEWFGGDDTPDHLLLNDLR